MADGDPINDVFSLLAVPLAGTLKTVEQFRKGVEEFLRGVENFNTTMENLNETATRINGLLEEIEAPIKAAMPQVTRAVKSADEMMQVVSGPAMAVAPGLERLAQTLSTPAFHQLPNQMGQFVELLESMANRMTPLSQLAESAGGLFGFRMPGTSAPKSAPAAEPAPAPSPPPPAKKSTAKKSTAKKSAPRKKSAAKKSTAKKR